MNSRNRGSIYVIAGMLLLLILTACQPTPTQEPQAPESALATASAVSQLSNQPGRAIVSARGNHFVVDSVPPLGGPNEELNPLDLILGALGTCGAFVYEAASKEMDLSPRDIVTTVEGDFDPRGVKGEPVNPRIQALRVHMDLEGIDKEQAAKLAEEFKARCPIFTTLTRAAPIEITTGAKPEPSVAEGLATARAVTRLSNQPGRAIVTARGNHFVVDSVPPLKGPNQERNPLDLILGALGTCGTFVYETAAQEMEIPLGAIKTTVEGDFDPRGVKGEPVDPRIQAFRVKMELEGPTADQAAQLAAEFEARCPIHTTLSRSAPITVENVVQ
jgi:uncharacterized OsmC-like protein